MSEKLTAQIVAIGTELLLGNTVDTNSAYIAKELGKQGILVKGVAVEGDDQSRIVSALQKALSESAVVFTTGGLGPTVDDKTRSSVAAAVGRELIFDEDLLKQIEARFAKFKRKMKPNNATQAYIPANAIALENPVGTAPCFIVEEGDKALISLPGVPREMKYMLHNVVIPYLRKRYNINQVLKTKTLHVVGMGESDIDSRISHLEELENPIVGLGAHAGVVDIRITASGDSEAEVDQLIADVETEARAQLGEAIYGEDGETPADAVIRMLRARQQTIYAVESGTASLLASRLAAADVGGETFVGADLGATKVHGSQLEPVVEALVTSKGAAVNADFVCANVVTSEGKDVSYGTAVWTKASGLLYSHHTDVSANAAYVSSWGANACMARLLKYLREVS